MTSVQVGPVVGRLGEFRVGPDTNDRGSEDDSRVMSSLPESRKDVSRSELGVTRRLGRMFISFKSLL